MRGRWRTLSGEVIVMGLLRDVQRTSYRISRAAGDANAAKRGTLGKRLVRRRVTRTLARPYNRLWR